MKNIKPNYPGTQSELYSIMRMAWNNCTSQIADFSSYKARYTTDYINGILEQIDNAEAMPDDDIRSGKHELMRTELVELNEVCCNNFFLLIGYVRDAFPKEQFDIQLDMAGKQNYRLALLKNWDETIIMNGKAITFITENKAALTANSNMPADFEGGLKTADITFTEKYNSYMSARQTFTGTAAKIETNNLLFDTTTDMLDDGKRIFASEPEKIKLFTFKVLRNMVTSLGGSSLRVSAIDQVTSAPIAGVNIELQTEDGPVITGTTNESGEFIVDSITAALYTGKAGKTGYAEAAFTKEVNIGTDARVTVTLSIAA